MTAETSKKKKGVRHLDSRRRSEIILMWKSGQFTLDQIATRVGAHRNTIVRLIKVAGVKKGQDSAAILAKAKERLEQEQQSEAEEVAKRIKETRNSAYKLLDVVDKMIAIEITEARKEKAHIGTRINNMKALNIASDTVLKNWRGRAEILGIADKAPDDADLPSLEITEMTNEQIREMQQRQAAFDEDSLLTQLEDAIEQEDIVVTVPDGVLRAEKVTEPIEGIAEDLEV
jgi:hypothetical protein